MNLGHPAGGGTLEKERTARTSKIRQWLRGQPPVFLRVWKLIVIHSQYLGTGTQCAAENIMHTLPVVFGVVPAVVVGVLSCCGPMAGTKGGGPPTTVGQTLFSDGVTTVTLFNKGDGFGPAPDPSDKCNRLARTFTFLPEKRMLKDETCDGTVKSTKSGTVEGAKIDKVNLALSKLKVVGEGNCGADKQNVELTIEQNGISQIYGDAFYGCVIKDKPLIDSGALSELDDAFRKAL